MHGSAQVHQQAVGLLQELEPPWYPDLHHAKPLGNKVTSALKFEITPNAKPLDDEVTFALKSKILPIAKLLDELTDALKSETTRIA